MNIEFEGLGDLYISIGNKIKEYEEKQQIKQATANIKPLYSINEVINIYPKLSKYLLTKAINDGLLPVMWIGHERHFYAEDIERYLNNSKKTNLNNWRLNEQE